MVTRLSLVVLRGGLSIVMVTRLSLVVLREGLSWLLGYHWWF